MNKPVINKLTRSSIIRKHSIKLYWCSLNSKSVVNITDACTVCVLGVLSRGLGNFGHALEDADSPAQQEVPESPCNGHTIYHQPPHGDKQEHIHSKIYPLQSIKYMYIYARQLKLGTHTHTIKYVFKSILLVHLLITI